MTSIFQRYAPQPSKLIAELVIVVVGILIALGIDEWREEIADSELEKDYLEQLIVDLEETERKMANASQAQFNTASQAATESLLAAFENPEVAEPDRINELLFEMSIFGNPVPVLGTFEALVSTGGLKLVRKAEIRSAITSYHSLVRDFYLVPLYQDEARFKVHYSQLTRIAIAYGLTPRGGDPKHHRNIERDITGFLTDSDAYAECIFLAETRSGAFATYRNRVAANAKELRQLLESSVSPE